MQTSAFGEYGIYYDLLYSDKDYLSESKYIQSLLNANGVASGNILEFGSGTGIHGCYLANNGYTVHGIELSESMVSSAQFAPGFSCQVGDVASVRMGRTYDAVLSLFHVISYQISNCQIQKVLKNAANHLDVGGVFIFDFWYTPAVYVQYPSVRVKRVQSDSVEVVRIAEPFVYSEENRVDVDYSIYVRDLKGNSVKYISEKHSMRHFTLPEIDILAASSGFVRINAEEFQSGHSPSVDTWGVCVTLKRVK